jgi:hypothetical protein
MEELLIEELQIRLTDRQSLSFSQSEVIVPRHIECRLDFRFWFRAGRPILESVARHPTDRDPILAYELHVTPSSARLGNGDIIAGHNVPGGCAVLVSRHTALTRIATINGQPVPRLAGDCRVLQRLDTIECYFALNALRISPARNGLADVSPCRFALEYE